MAWEAGRSGADGTDGGGPRKEYVSALVALGGGSGPGSSGPGTARHRRPGAPRLAAGRPCRRSLRPSPRPPQGSPPGRDHAPSTLDKRGSRIEKRTTLRCRVPSDGASGRRVLFDHRHHGRVLNLSRAGLAIEIGEAPSFSRRARLRVEREEQEPLDLEVAVIWCRMVGTEDGEGDEVLPRYQVGLACDDPGLLELGAPPAALER